MTNIICEDCGKEMRSTSGTSMSGGSWEETFDCTCGERVKATFQRQIPEWADITAKASYKCDEKDPVKCCDECEEAPEPCYPMEAVKCEAPREERIPDLERRVKKLELEKKILDLTDAIYRAQERERIRG